jgi:hypothetical protein
MDDGGGGGLGGVGAAISGALMGVAGAVANFEPNIIGIQAALMIGKRVYQQLQLLQTNSAHAEAVRLRLCIVLGILEDATKRPKLIESHPLLLQSIDDTMRKAYAFVSTLLEQRSGFLDKAKSFFNASTTQEQLSLLDRALQAHVVDLNAALTARVGAELSEKVDSVGSNIEAQLKSVKRAIGSSLGSTQQAVLAEMSVAMSQKMNKKLTKLDDVVALLERLRAGAFPLGQPASSQQHNLQLPQQPASSTPRRLISFNELDFRSSVKLGAGAFGAVRSALWRNTPVAVKEVLMDESMAGCIDQEALEDLHREVALHWGLRHPNVVTVYGSIEDQQDPAAPRYGIVMERMARSLFNALRDGFVMRERLAICLGIASGLAYLHAEGIVHAGQWGGAQRVCFDALRDRVVSHASRHSVARPRMCRSQVHERAAGHWEHPQADGLWAFICQVHRCWRSTRDHGCGHRRGHTAVDGPRAAQRPHPGRSAVQAVFSERRICARNHHLRGVDGRPSFWRAPQAQSRSSAPVHGTQGHAAVARRHPGENPQARHPAHGARLGW